MRRIVLPCVLVAVSLTACGGGAEAYESVSEVAAALADEGISCPSVEPSPPGELVAYRGTCEGHDLYVFDDEDDRDRWLEVGAGLGDVVVGPNWAIVPDGDAEDIADALGGDVR